MSVFEDLLKDKTDVSLRLAVRQFEKLLREPGQQALMNDANGLSFVAKMLKSNAGMGTVECVLGVLPLLVASEHPVIKLLAPISGELRQRGLELVGDQLADLVMEPLRLFVADLIKNGLPAPKDAPQLPESSSVEKVEI